MADEETMAVGTRCPICGRSRALSVSIAGYNAWKRGELIQCALPTLTDDEREGLITGICGSCWARDIAAPGQGSCPDE